MDIEEFFAYKTQLRVAMNELRAGQCPMSHKKFMASKDGEDICLHSSVCLQVVENVELPSGQEEEKKANSVSRKRNVFLKSIYETKYFDVKEHEEENKE